MNIIEIHEQPSYEIEKIVKKKIEKGQTYYLVQWKGYPGQDTWEPKTV